MSEPLIFPTADLIYPRDEAGREPTPVLDVLGLAAKPWVLNDVSKVLRLSGLAIPRKAEAEMAASLHYLTRLAIEHGPTWRDAALADRDRIIAEYKAAHP